MFGDVTLKVYVIVFKVIEEKIVYRDRIKEIEKIVNHPVIKIQ